MLADKVGAFGGLAFWGLRFGVYHKDSGPGGYDTECRLILLMDKDLQLQCPSCENQGTFCFE